MWKYICLITTGALTTHFIDWGTNHSLLSIPLSIGLITVGWCIYIEKSVGGYYVTPRPEWKFGVQTSFSYESNTMATI